MERIRIPKMSEMLKEYMEPEELSAYKLATEINVPVSRIQDLLHDRRRMTADTSLRLGKYFGLSDDFFLRLQNEIDIRNVRRKISKEIEAINTINN